MSRKPPFSKPYTVRRRDAAGEVVDFVWVPGTPFDVDLWATIQPLSGEQLRDLPPGLSGRATFACFTFEKLVTIQTGGTLPDLITVRGKPYEVHGGFEDGDFDSPIDGYEYILAKPEPGGRPS